MKGLVYTQPFRVEMMDLPEPELQTNQVLVRVRACGICGSDLLGFAGKSKKRIPPLVLGHELSGEVVGVGAEVKDVECGARVSVFPLSSCGVCVYCESGRNHLCANRHLMGLDIPGGFEEFVAVPSSAVFKLPESISYVEAALVEPLATAIHVIAKVKGEFWDSIAILGAGTVGLLVLQVARLAGFSTIAISDLSDNRLDVAKNLGADLTVNGKSQDLLQEILRFTNGNGADVVIDAVGTSKTRQQAIAAVKRGGTIALVGLNEEQTELNLYEVVAREIQICGSYAYSRADFGKAIDLISSGKIDAKSWVQKVPLDQGQEIFQNLIEQRDDNLVKVSLVL
jgi:L-iditol 2-dehydrogenase